MKTKAQIIVIYVLIFTFVDGIAQSV
jgi:hypothetical protein